MRNLKRALSLTLASVMLLGMMIVGTSAVSFNDADEISNVTAATVLQDLNIMVGDGENFMPDQIVTRGQMAIIVCKILYGDRLNVSQFADYSQYTDVAVGDYFNGYVNLATSLGIISGYGNGQFGPGDPVTTAQAALMLCKALGWFKADELKGDWATDSMTAITQATQLKLFGKLKLSNNEGLTRDNVAEMTFNTITKAVPVMYNDKWSVYYTDSQDVLGGTKFNYLNTLGFENYDLVYKTVTNSLGQIQTRWGIGAVSGGAVDTKGDLKSDSVTIAGKDKIIDIANEVVARYDSKMVDKVSTVRSDISGYTLNGDNTATKWVNGDDGGKVISSAADIAALATGNGVVVEVYATDGVITDVVQIIEEMTQVSAVNTSKKTITLSRGGDASVVLDENDDAYHDLNGQVEIGDYVLAVFNAGNEAQRVSLPETVSGVVSRYNQDGHLTLDGTVYKPSTLDIDVATANNLTAAKAYQDTKSECVIYLDSCGYALAVDNKLANAEHVCYVAAVNKPDVFSDYYRAYVFLEDGTSGTYTIASVNDKSSLADVQRLAEPGLYVYRLSDKNISLLTTTHSSLSGTFGVTGEGSISGIKHNTAGYKVNNTQVYLTAETVFFSRDLDKGTNAADVVKEDYVSVSTGLSSIDEKPLSNVVVLYETVNGRNVARAVYSAQSGSVAGFSADLIYVSNQDWYSADNIDYDMDVVFTGETEKKAVVTKGNPGVGLYTYSIDNKGVYRLTDAVENGKAAYSGEMTMIGKDTMIINGVQINKVKEALVFDNTTTTIAQTNQSFLNFTDDLHYYGYVAVNNTNDRNALAIYVVARAEEVLGGIYEYVSGTGVESDPIVIKATGGSALALPEGYEAFKKGNTTNTADAIGSMGNEAVFQIKKDGATTLWYKLQVSADVTPGEIVIPENGLTVESGKTLGLATDVPEGEIKGEGTAELKGGSIGGETTISSVTKVSKETPVDGTLTLKGNSIAINAPVVVNEGGKVVLEKNATYGEGGEIQLNGGTLEIKGSEVTTLPKLTGSGTVKVDESGSVGTSGDQGNQATLERLENSLGLTGETGETTPGDGNTITKVTYTFDFSNSVSFVANNGKLNEFNPLATLASLAARTGGGEGNNVVFIMITAPEEISGEFNVMYKVKGDDTLKEYGGSEYANWNFGSEDGEDEPGGNFIIPVTTNVTEISLVAADDDDDT